MAFPTLPENPIGFPTLNSSGGTFSTGKMLLEHEVAELLGMTCPTLRTWRKSGRGPAFVCIGRNIRYAAADIEAFIAEHRVPQGGKR